MSKKNTAQPANPFHPGEILLEEFLQPGKITQAAFARKIGWTKARVRVPLSPPVTILVIPWVTFCQRVAAGKSTDKSL